MIHAHVVVEKNIKTAMENNKKELNPTLFKDSFKKNFKNGIIY